MEKLKPFFTVSTIAGRAACGYDAARRKDCGGVQGAFFDARYATDADANAITAAAALHLLQICAPFGYADSAVLHLKESVSAIAARGSWGARRDLNPDAGGVLYGALDLREITAALNTFDATAISEFFTARRVVPLASDYPDVQAAFFTACNRAISGNGARLIGETLAREHGRGLPRGAMSDKGAAARAAYRAAAVYLDYWGLSARQIAPCLSLSPQGVRNLLAKPL